MDTIEEYDTAVVVYHPVTAAVIELLRDGMAYHLDCLRLKGQHPREDLNLNSWHSAMLTRYSGMMAEVLAAILPSLTTRVDDFTSRECISLRMSSVLDSREELAAAYPVLAELVWFEVANG